MKKLLILLLLLFPSICFGANRYVTSNGTGAGTSWSAPMALPSGSNAYTLGDVYYLADGVYNKSSAIVVGANGTSSSSSYITIKKATATDHGSETGWPTDNSLGDGVAEIVSSATRIIELQDNYTVIDGQIGENNGTVTHGIKIRSTTLPTVEISIHGIHIVGGLDYITLSHLELQGSGCQLGIDARSEGIYKAGSTYAYPCTNILIRYCYMHQWQRCCILWQGIADSTIEYCYFRYHGSGYSGAHSNTIDFAHSYGNINMTIRYNTFVDVRGTNAISMMDNYETVGSPIPNYNVYCYGNLFYDTADTVTPPVGGTYVPYMSDGTLTNTGSDDGYNFYYYNNTHVDLNKGSGGNHTMQVGTTTGNRSYAYNNLFVNSDNIGWGNEGIGSYIEHNYNSYGNTRDSTTQNTGTGNNESGGQYSVATSIFSNYSGRDYRLYYATSAGYQMAAPYNYDRDGNMRGADGVWDRGAYEYTGVQLVHYIRVGATGDNDGTSWAHAWTSIPTSLERGHTYYVADGLSYAAYNFDDPTDGTKYITIKKATVSDHGNNTGWFDTYGDGAAKFVGTVNFNTSYYVFDGNTRSSNWKSGYGFVIDRSTGTSLPCIGIPGYGNSTNATNITIKNTELIGFITGDTNAPDGVYMNPSGSGNNNITFSSCYIHDVARCPFLGRNSTDITIEYCYMARNENTSPQHSEGISAADAGSGPTNRWTVRWNIWEDIEGTGIIMFSGDGWKIYGNLFFHTGLATNDGIGQGCVGTWTGYVVTNSLIYNNTAVDLKLHTGTVTTGVYLANLSSNTGNLVYNNLFYNCASMSMDTYATHAYNAYSNASSGTLIETGTGQYSIPSTIFTNYIGDVFTLASATSAGTTLASPYDMDMNGVYRGSGGVWDRGAYEYSGASETYIRYVRAGATGTGTGLDWTNAYTTLPDDLLRGYTYYIAGGTYADDITLDDAVSGTTQITIKKATTDNHGTSVGWATDNSYGTTQALFTGRWYIQTGYYSIDGQVGAGKATTAYGIKIRNTDVDTLARNLMYINAGNLSIKYVEFSQSGCDAIYDLNNQDCIYSNPGTTISNIYIGYSYFHHASVCHMRIRDWDLGTIEYCYFYCNNSGAAGCGGGTYHGEPISAYATNMIYRYNIFEDICGTCLVCNQYGPIEAYGNLSFNTFTSDCLYGGWGDAKLCAGVKNFNNTAINSQNYTRMPSIFDTSSLTYNNIFFDSENIILYGTHNYNAADVDLGETNDQIIDSSYFVNYAGGDFRLAKATNAGMNLNTMTPPTTTTTATATTTTPTTSTSSSTSTIYEGAPDCSKDNLKFYDNFEHPTLLSGGNYSDGMYNITEGGGCTDSTDKTGDVYVENTYDHATDATHRCTNVCVDTSQKVTGSYSLYHPCNGDRMIFGYGSSYNATPHIDWRIGTVKFFFRIEHYFDDSGSNSGSWWMTGKGSNGLQGYIMCAIFGTGGTRTFRLSYNNQDGGGSQYVQTSTYDNLRADKWYYAVVNWRTGTTLPSMRVKVCDQDGTNCSTQTYSTQIRPMLYGEMGSWDIGEWNHQDLSGWVDDLYVYGDWRD